MFDCRSVIFQFKLTRLRRRNREIAKKKKENGSGICRPIVEDEDILVIDFIKPKNKIKSTKRLHRYSNRGLMHYVCEH